MPPAPAGPAELPVLSFKTQRAWAAWLKKNHARSAGVWLKLARKGAGPSLTYAQAVEEALCYGWIDGQAKPLDDTAWLQRYTPRRPRSPWSKINRAKAEALLAAGRLQPAGLAAIEAAKVDGRWAAAYDSPAAASVPDDLQAELDRRPRAKAFFASLNSANRYAITYRLQNAKKPETRARRLAQFVDMLERGEKLHP
jgi:uncharacterized protein YdeI (YjbR/CyaY-like superfamily)